MGEQRIDVTSVVRVVTGSGDGTPVGPVVLLVAAGSVAAGVITVLATVSIVSIIVTLIVTLLTLAGLAAAAYYGLHHLRRVSERWADVGGGWTASTAPHLTATQACDACQIKVQGTAHAVVDGPLGTRLYLCRLCYLAALRGALNLTRMLEGRTR